MTQRLVWPAELQRQEDGSILVSFPDIPEALTEGATEAEALVEAQDCVIVRFWHHSTIAASIKTMS